MALSRYGRWPRRAMHRPVSGGQAGRMAPGLERFGSEEAVGVSRDKMTRNGEEVVGGRVQGQEPLADRGDLNPCSLRSRRRTGTCELSARLLARLRRV